MNPGDTLIAEALIEYEDDDCIDKLTSDEEVCTEFELDTDKFEKGIDQEVCITDTDSPYFDKVEYETSDGKEGDFEIDDECFIIEKEVIEDANWIDIWVPGWKDPCIWRLDHKVEPPDFDKNAKSQDSSAYSSRTVSNFSDDYVNYEITYTHYADEDINVNITDTIGTDDYIQGYIADSVEDIDSAPLGGQIYYDDNYEMAVYVDGARIEACDDDTEDDICYEGNIGDSGGIEIMNVPDREEVRVEYRGEIVDSKVTPENCSNTEHVIWTSKVCGEIYPNTARFDDKLDFDGESDAEVLIPCPFIIIRAGGDVFLENPFDYGVDTLSCAEIRTSDTPVIKGTPPSGQGSPGTGPGSSALQEYSDRLCNSEDATDIKGISSLICELELTSEDLTQRAIVQSLSRNIQLFARYSRNLNGTPVVSGSSTLDRINSSNEVYIKDNETLTLGGEFAGKARTIVVLNNDVYINKNLTFKDPKDLSDPREIPSLAVIVIGGNIIIDPGVSETNAIFFVQEGEDGGRSDL